VNYDTYDDKKKIGRRGREDNFCNNEPAYCSAYTCMYIEANNRTDVKDIELISYI